MKPWQISAVVWLGSALVRTLAATWRIRVKDESGLTTDRSVPPVIWAFWHNRLLLIPFLRERFAPWRLGTALASASKDGELVARFLATFDILAARGSSSRRGVAGLRELVAAMESGRDGGITPDGPRGPIYSVQPGIIGLAQMTGAAISPVHIRCHSAWRLKSWDRFMVPKPFARIEVTLAPLHRVAATTDDAGFAAEREKLRALLMSGVEE